MKDGWLLKVLVPFFFYYQARQSVPHFVVSLDISSGAFKQNLKLVAHDTFRRLRMSFYAFLMVSVRKRSLPGAPDTPPSQKRDSIAVYLRLFPGLGDGTQCSRWASAQDPRPATKICLTYYERYVPDDTANKWFTNEYSSVVFIARGTKYDIFAWFCSELSVGDFEPRPAKPTVSSIMLRSTQRTVVLSCCNEVSYIVSNRQCQYYCTSVSLLLTI